MGRQRIVVKGIGLKIGRISRTVAKQSGLQCADIYLSEDYLKHISGKHIREIEKVGLTPEDFIRCIAKEYNRIVKGSDDSIMLVVYRKNKGLHYAAALRLIYVNSSNLWKVTTAGVRRTTDIEKRKVFWESCQLSSL
jgi:hypothetical protein